jgi:hypothetical protein
MSRLSSLSNRITRSPRLQLFGRALPRAPSIDARPDWQQADPAWIRRALARSQALPGGGWYVLDATRAFGTAPRKLMLLGRPLVVWRDGPQLLAAPDACPHMGASLSEGKVCDGRLVCPWHGLSLGTEPVRGFKPLTTHDDGHLLWVRVPGREVESARPFITTRPAASSAIDACIRVEARCEPRDVIANRLDPWHGVHYHPHSFGSLRVIDQVEDAITVRVAYRVAGPLAMEVDARFDCADPRTIVMTIVRGDGEGSVVETHATPLAQGLTAVVELTLATSDRIGFGVARQLGGLLRPAMQWAARRLWREDAAYAERLYALRERAVLAKSTARCGAW